MQNEGRIKKIYLINFEFDESELGVELQSLLQTKEVEVTTASANEFVIDIGGAEKCNKILLNGSPLESKDSIFFIRKRSKKYTFFTSLLSRFLERNKYTTLNPLFAEHQKSIGKFAQGINVSAKGYCVPRTIIASPDATAQYKDYIEQSLSYPLIVKGSGSGGNAVWKVHNWTEVEEKIKLGSERIKDAVLFQEFVTQSHEEYRIVFFAEEVVSAVCRASDGFYNNYAQGASVTYYDLPKEEERVCFEIAKQSGLDYVAIDYMKLEDGKMVFMEVQTGPSLDVSKIANPKVVESIAGALRKKYL